MKKKVRIIALALAILMLLGAFSSIFAKGEDNWSKDVFAYGSGLNDEQIDKTAEILGIDDLDKVNKIKVDAEDLYKYLKLNGADWEMISSIYAVKGKNGSGLEIIVTSDDKITQVTSEEYTNAAITAGVKDAKIYVGAYTTVTGTSALTGVYKAFEFNGEKLDDKRVQVANDELETVNAIVTEHKDEEGFDSSKLNKAVADVKESLIDYKKDNKENATEQKIRDIIVDASTKYEINNIITQNNIDKLVVYFQNFQNSPAIDSKDIKNQLETFGKDLSEKIDNLLKDKDGKLKDGVDKVKDGAKEGLEKAKDFVNSDEAKGFFEKIADFFKEIFNKISELFKG